MEVNITIDWLRSLLARRRAHNECTRTSRVSSRRLLHNITTAHHMFGINYQRKHKEKSMTRVRIAILAAALATFVALLFIGGGVVAPPATNAQVRPVKVNYVAIPGGDYKIDPAHSTI